jgi:formylglycine-generating enzyme required for sulfatase activity
LTEAAHVFLSYSHADSAAADNLRAQLDRAGLSVFRDAEKIRQGDLWLRALQDAVDACGCFVVLVGRDGVTRWVGAETQAALNRHFGPRDDAQRLPIFPILLGDILPETLPAFLRLFQTERWNGVDALPATLFEQLRNRTLVPNQALTFEGCPFVGLNAYQVDQAQLFFGRQQDTLEALACFDTRPGHAPVRWLEINGNSGSGKSSLMNAGLLPLVDQGWLWPRTGYAQWQRIGTKTSGEHPVVTAMMPGQYPVRMLAEQLAATFGAEMTDVRTRLEQGDDSALAEWLRSRKRADTAFLLAIDQCEELFTFADPAERTRFDRLLAAALADVDCPLFVISTVRADFLDRFESDLPRLNALRRGPGRSWPLPLLGETGLREVIEGPARLANLDVTAVEEAMVAEARDEPGALPLVENALYWLWENREQDPRGGKVRLSGQLFSQQGGLAGILSQSADDLLASLGPRRERALELLFRLVKVDPEGRRHTRRRIPLTEAIEIAGGGARGRELVDRLAGQRALGGGKGHGPLRLITVTEELAADNSGEGKARWVNLIHETLIRSKNLVGEGKPQPYWPTLWQYIETHKERAAQREQLELMARQWKGRRGLARLFGLVGWWELFGFWKLAARGSLERTYLRWSATRASIIALVLAVLIGILGESAWWAQQNGLPPAYTFIKPLWMLGYLPEPEMVEIPQGTFTMGCVVGRDDFDGKCAENETPARQVTIGRPFTMGKYEVTFLQYDTYVWHMRREGKTDIPYPVDQGWGRFDRPVIDVSWHDAKAYAAWLSKKTGKPYRLPTEAEWEYAARGGTQKRYGVPGPDGSDDIAGKGLANCRECGSEWDGEKTAPVGRFPANPWGLHDTAGNAWEWVEDAYQERYPEGPTGPEAAELAGSVSRVLRGGSWGLDPWGCRAAFRDYYSAPAYRGSPFGFRLCCSSPIE